ncbi:hypothetical protein ACLKA6_016469 [Drosophila palustris]
MSNKNYVYATSAPKHRLSGTRALRMPPAIMQPATPALFPAAKLFKFLEHPATHKTIRTKLPWGQRRPPEIGNDKKTQDFDLELDSDLDCGMRHINVSPTQ